MKNPIVQVLEDCKKKLQAYQSEAGNGYPGGPLLQDLYPAIDDAILTLTTEALPRAMTAVTAQMNEDFDYAWSWHCNIAMSAVDAGCDHMIANEGAARFLQMLAGVDTRQHAAFKAIQNAQVPVIDLEKTAWESIKKAAEESNWIPREHYMLSDWVDDVCRMLRFREDSENPVADYETFVDGQWERRRLPEVEAMPEDMQRLRNLYIMTCGIGGEAGEVQELLKKHVRDGVLDTNKLIKELGDVLYYLTRIASFFGSNLRTVMATNKAKLLDRNINGKKPE